MLGCALIGVLMVLVSEGGRTRARIRWCGPSSGVGVLGGFTTFSTYAVDFSRLLDEGGRAPPWRYAGRTVRRGARRGLGGAAARRAALRRAGARRRREAR